MRAGWPILRDALDNAFDGDGGLLLALADIYADRQEDGTYANNANEVIVAVNCLDRPQTGDLDSIRADAAEFAAVSDAAESPSKKPNAIGWGFGAVDPLP